MVDIYRADTIISSVEIDDNSVFKHAIMGDEVCELNFVSKTFTAFQLGDYINYEEQQFTINTEPKNGKIANNEYSYNLRFEGIRYDLGKILYKLDGKLEFPLNSDIEQILDLVIINMNENSTILWQKGTYSITPFYNFEFSNENCLQVMSRACNEFEVEFEVITSGGNYVINVRDIIGIYDGVTLEYKKGIYQINKEALDQENIVTKLYPRGASRNIPSGYGYDRIRINPLLNNNDIYGIFEKVKIWDDIFPEFTGSVDSSLAYNLFTDSDIDFDLNAQLIPGVSAKVVFLSGLLAGYEFEVNSYDNITKTVTLNYFNNDIGQKLPGTNFEINIDDRYTFVDIYMPQSYIDAAELELTNRATEYIEKYSIPLEKYSVNIDARYLRERNIQLYAGQKIILKDLDFNINKELRIYSIVQSMADPFSYQIQLTDNNQTNRLVRLVYGQYDIERVLENYRKEFRILKNN